MGEITDMGVAGGGLDSRECVEMVSAAPGDVADWRKRRVLTHRYDYTAAHPCASSQSIPRSPCLVLHVDLLSELRGHRRGSNL